ncbi:MAG: HAD-IA family hydrolase [Clostridia bacterium]|nr:HAD-IA family hydrolase [Clostridia bacterium]
MIKAVLFDMDGTLADTVEDLAVAVNHVFASYGLEPRPAENFKRYAGSGARKMLERAWGDEPRPCPIEEALSAFQDYYKAHFHDRTKPYPGIAETVDALYAQGMKLGVVTNKIQYMSEHLAELLFAGKFSTVQGQRDPYPTKPDPALPNMAAADLGVRPEECLFVGDSDVDIITAHQFGCKAVGVLWGFRSREELARQGAEYLVSDPREILDIVAKENHTCK